MNYDLLRRLESGVSAINKTINMMEEDEALVRSAIGGELQQDCIKAIDAAKENLRKLKQQLYQLHSEQEQLE